MRALVILQGGLCVPLGLGGLCGRFGSGTLEALVLGVFILF
jgi:hypothetical protein